MLQIYTIFSSVSIYIHRDISIYTYADIYTCIYMDIYIDVYIHVYICAHTHIYYIYICMCICVCVCVHVVIIYAYLSIYLFHSLSLSIYIYIYMSVCVCVCVYAWVCVCVCVCVCAGKSRKVHRQITYLLMMTFLATRIQAHWRSQWTTKRTMLKNRPHFVIFYENILVSLWTFLPTLAYVYRYICSCYQMIFTNHHTYSHQRLKYIYTDIHTNVYMPSKVFWIRL